MLHDVENFKDPEIRKLVRHGWAATDSLFGEGPPEALLGDYQLSADGVKRQALMQQKYATRRHNIERCWSQVQLYLPELLTAPPQDVLEISTGHGAMLEVLRHYGHTVMGTDYSDVVWSGAMFSDTPKPDWPYRHVVESVGLPMTVFDGRTTPYPFADNSYDTLICARALDQFGHPDDWMEFIDEFCRISRRSVFVMLNRAGPDIRAGRGDKMAFDDFRLALRRYRQNGFVCTATFTHWDQALGFKLTVT